MAKRKKSQWAREGAVVKRKRKQLGWTQKELAGRVGVDVSTISNIENGKRGFSGETFVTIPRELGLSKAQLADQGEELEKQSRWERPVTVIGVIGYDAKPYAPDEASKGTHSKKIYIPYEILPDKKGYLVQMDGDSMKPGIRHKQYAMVAPDAKYGNGDDVMLYLKGKGVTKAYLRVLHFSKGQPCYMLLSHNPAFYPDCVKKVDVIGIHRVIGAWNADI